jgi:hypothetical protein
VTQEKWGGSSTFCQAIRSSYDQILAFVQQQDFESQMSMTFGLSYDSGKAAEFFRGLSEQDLAELPRIGLLDDAVLNGARGAYVQEIDTIYLSRQFVDGSSVDRITGVLIEELGHALDARVNLIDADGDEGDIFSRLVRGQSIDFEQLRLLKVEDDHDQIIVDGRILAVEQSQDFNNDTKVDILWRHTNGNNVAWLMNGVTQTGSQSINSVADPLWKIRGTGDFNQDGQTDILWWNSGSGTVGVWLMNGSVQVDWKVLGTVADTRWTIAIRIDL